MRVLQETKCGLVGLALAMVIALPSVPVRADPIVADGLTRLAGTLGAVHYLRTLCQPGTGQQWRDKMLEMLSTGDLNQKRKDKLISAFNTGYSRQQTAHSACTQAAATLGNTYAQQGAADARAIARRLGR